jgi:hypothetical protein
MRRFTLAVLFIFGSVLSAFACDCFEYPSHKEEFRKSGAVFVGEVIKIETPNANARKNLPDDLKHELGDLITFRVIKKWKGSNKEQVVWTHATFELCSKWKFKIGQRYLIYEQKIDSVLLGAEFCSRTRPLETTDQNQIKEFKELDTFN